MKSFFLIVLTILPFYLFSQSSKFDAIKIIEDLTYDEYYLFEKSYNKLEITFDQTLGKMVFKSINFIDQENIIENKYSFFINDIDTSVIEYDTTLIEGLYVVIVKLKANKKKSIERAILSKSGRTPFPVYDKQFLSEFYITSNKALPYSYVQKLLDSFKVLFDVNGVEKTVIYKSNK